MGEGIALMRNVHRHHELLLEVFVDRSLNIPHVRGDLPCQGAFFLVQQSDAGTITGGVAHGVNVVEITIRDQAQDHGMPGFDITTKGAGQHNPVHSPEAGPVHQRGRPQGSMSRHAVR